MTSKRYERLLVFQVTMRSLSSMHTYNISRVAKALRDSKYFYESRFENSLIVMSRGKLLLRYHYEHLG